MVAVHVTLQVEAASELFVAALLGAQEFPLLPRMDAQLVLVQEPGVTERLLAPAARHLGCRDRLKQVSALQSRPPEVFRLP